MQIVIVGFGAAGKATAAVCSRIYPGAKIWVTYHDAKRKPESVELPSGVADFQLDVSLPANVWLAVIEREVPGVVDLIVFTPAYGRVCLQSVSEQAIIEARRVTITPVRELCKLPNKFTRVVAFTTFTSLPIVSLLYGAMLPVKRELAALVHEYEQLRIVCAGTFFSRSLWAIFLALKRMWRRLVQEAPDHPLVSLVGKEKDIDQLQPTIIEILHSQELDLLWKHLPIGESELNMVRQRALRGKGNYNLLTSIKDIEKAIYDALTTPTQVQFFNVIGPYVWHTAAPV